MVDKTRFKMIGRKLKTPSIVLAPYDLITLHRKPFGDLQFIVLNSKELVELKNKPIKTPSTKFAYFSMSEGTYYVTLQSEYYLAKEFTLQIPDVSHVIDDEVSVTAIQGGILVELKLKPSSVYPFPSGATLIRIVAKRPSGLGIPSASVLVQDEAGVLERTLVSRTDKNGQAVLYCNRMTNTSILQINGIDVSYPKNLVIWVKDPKNNQFANERVDVQEFWSQMVKIEM